MLERPPDWRLPRGVSRGLWDYTQSATLAGEYDQRLAGHPLLEFDEQLLARWLARPGVVLDLGCGTGRSLLAMACRGHRGIGVDLSTHMLRAVRDKATRAGLDVELIVANMAALDGLRDSIADYCISLFSSWGMIRGADARHAALLHARRLLRADGRLVLHVHNRWTNLRSVAGRRWLMANWWAARGRREEPGDKYFDAWGVQNVYLHVFTRTELKNALAAAGFEPIEWVPLSLRGDRRLAAAWFGERLRAGGWIVLARPS